MLVLIVFAAAFTSCKSDDDGGTSASANGTLTAKVDGQSYESMPEATTAEESNSGGVSTLVISGGSIDSENIQFMLIGFDGEGTYQLNNINLGTYTYLENPSDFNSVMLYTTVTDGSTNGEIKISSYTPGENVQGTFSFTGYNNQNVSDSKVISEGSFNVDIRN